MTEMFFVRQVGNQCGLHAIQNMFKSAAVTADELHEACESIHKDTGDEMHHHETFGGDWSMSAMTLALSKRGYEVQRAVISGIERQWSAPEFESLMADDTFRGMLVHQPMSRHYTCIRPEIVEGKRALYYVDSQSAGPIKISPRLAKRRCLSQAYAWEPFVVRGKEMEHVPAQEDPISIHRGIALEDTRQRPRIRPPADFMRDWQALAGSRNEEKHSRTSQQIQTFEALTRDNTTASAAPGILDT